MTSLVTWSRALMFAVCAAASAESAMTVMNAFSDGFRRSIFSRHSRVSSTGETSRRRMLTARSVIVGIAFILIREHTL